MLIEKTSACSDLLRRALVLSALLLVAPKVAEATSISFVSNTSWTMTNPVIAGSAQASLTTFEGCTNCTYAPHLGGVVFGESLSSAGATQVPEPATIFLLGTALGGLSLILRRSRPRPSSSRRVRD